MAAAQEFGVVGKASDEIADMVGEFRVTPADMRQIGVAGAGFGLLGRPHRVGIDVVPFDDDPRTPIRRHAAHGEDIVVDGAPIGGQEADRHHRIADDLHRGVEGRAFGLVRFVLLGARLQDRFEIDRHRMIAGGDHVLLMHVGRREDVEQREQSAGAAEKARDAAIVVAAGMRNVFRPAIAIAGDGADRFERERRVGAR